VAASLIAKKYIIAQSATEIALGSIIHAFHIPLGGHVLSLNQIVLLTLASKKATDRKMGASLASQISNTSAALKTLSPMGSRVRPMLAISAQGLLFSVGQLIFGPTLWGAILGSALSSVWGFLQPLLISSFILGGIFLEGIEKLWTEVASIFHLSPSFGIKLLIAIVLLKAVIASILAGTAWLSGSTFEDRYMNQIEEWSKAASISKKPASSPLPGNSPINASLKELLHPWFLASLVLTLIFFICVKHPTTFEMILYVLRIVAGALLVTWGVKAIPSSWTKSWTDQDLKNASRR
jgi:hypothetical protein